MHFAAVAEPLILYDEDNWQRPAPTELYAYPSMVADQGLNNIADHFFLTYMYVPPDEDFSQRYLVAQEGWIRASRAAAISASADSSVTMGRRRWPHMDDDGSDDSAGPFLFLQSDDLGYLMTAPPPQNTGVKLDECFSDRPALVFLPMPAVAGRRQRTPPPGRLCIPFRTAPGTDAAVRLHIRE